MCILDELLVKKQILLPIARNSLIAANEPSISVSPIYTVPSRSNTNNSTSLIFFVLSSVTALCGSTYLFENTACIRVSEKIVALRPRKSKRVKHLFCAYFAFEPIPRVGLESAPKSLHTVQVYAGKFFKQIHTIFAQYIVNSKIPVNIEKVNAFALI